MESYHKCATPRFLGVAGGGKPQKRAFAAPAARSPQDVRAIATVDLEALTKRDMLELAAELIYNVLEEP